MGEGKEERRGEAMAVSVTSGAARVGRWLGALGGLCALAASAGVRCEDGWIARLGVESGGDTLVTARLESGDDVELKGGGAVHLELGARRGVFGRPTRWESELTLGYKAVSDTRDNGEMSFTRLTLNAQQHYRLAERVRVGAGLTYHVRGELDIDAPGLRDAIEADDDFHHAIASVSGLERLWRTIELEKAHVDRCRHRMLPLPGEAETTLAHHRCILDALRSRDPERARETMAAHLDTAWDSTRHALRT